MMESASGPGAKMGRERAASLIRPGAERYLLLVIVSFVVAVVGTRWYLDATGYPQIGGGELHVAHMLWGGLLLVVAVLLPLLLASERALALSAICAGAGTGLFIDEVGKFITASNDYFYPLAAPLIYGLLLFFVLVFVLVRRRPDAQPVVIAPRRLRRWEEAHLGRRRYRRLLMAALLVTASGWLLSLLVYLLVDETTLREAIQSAVNVVGSRIERPTEPVFWILEALVLGGAGLLLAVGVIALARGREEAGTHLATIGLVLALTAGAILSLYVEQVSAMGSTLLNAALLLAIVHYRNRFLAGTATATPGPPGSTARPV